jgi:tetratricopeptide (TPR) repeat protein
LLVIITLLSGQNGFGQSKAQSKKQETYRDYKSRSSSTSITRLLADANAAMNSDPTRALDNVQEALAISVADGNDFNEAKCYLLIGEINEQIVAWSLARDNYQKAYQVLSTRYPSTAEFGKTLRGLGKSNMELKSYAEALSYFQQALNQRGVSQSQLQLDVSEVYYRMGKYAEAKRAVDEITFGKVIDESFQTLVQNQKVKIETQLHEPNASGNLYKNSLNSLRSGGNVAPQTQQSLSETKEEVAGVLRGEERYDEEIDLRNKAIEFNLESKNLSEVTKDKVAISRTLEAKGESGAALKEMEEAAQFAETLDDPKAKANAFLSLATLYEKNGRTSQALEVYKKYSEAVTDADKQNENKLIKKEEILNKQQEIEELTLSVSLGRQEETLQTATVFRQQLIIYGLIAIILIIGVAAYFIYRSAQASKVANQLLALKSLRSQMNPHFIFNALNSVNHFIAQQDERTANKFLSEFSQLMRLVLENSEQDFITLNKEQEMLSLYLKLEHYRFRDKFDYEFETGNGINGELVELPPMLIQPYIENAVWHGLRYKETKGRLSVRFTKQEKEIEVSITDDGIGRKKSGELKTPNQKKHNSSGLKNIRERLSIINNVYKSNYRVSIEDLTGDGGTIVKIHIPILANRAS